MDQLVPKIVVLGSINLDLAPALNDFPPELLKVDLQDAVRYANAAGALAASQHGTQASMANHKTNETLLGSQV